MATLVDALAQLAADAAALSVQATKLTSDILAAQKMVGGQPAMADTGEPGTTDTGTPVVSTAP